MVKQERNSGILRKFASMAKNFLTIRWGALLLCVALLCSELPKRALVLNLSPSVPIGFYVSTDKGPTLGSLAEVCVQTPSSNGTLLERFVLKPIAAGPADLVDTTADWLIINGRPISPIPTTDSCGKPIAPWRGYRALSSDEYFLYSDRVFNSWDSRYFGPILREEIIAVRRPLLTWGQSTGSIPPISLSKTTLTNLIINKTTPQKPIDAVQDKRRESAGAQLLMNQRNTGTLINFTESDDSQLVSPPRAWESPMSKTPQNPEENEQIGRTGLGGPKPSQRIHFPRMNVWAISRGPTTFDKFSRPQRVVVKGCFGRHISKQKAAESLSYQARYLGRDSASRDSSGVQFYDRQREDIDAKLETTSWVNDRHHFRFIVSPENAHKLNDLKAYIREVMAQVERDLGPLQWLAVNHSNTENPHTHILIRGKAHNGADLVMSRRYIATGIRQRASEVATFWLGERTCDELEITRTKELHVERWTSLDGILARVAKKAPEGLVINSKEIHLGPYAKATGDALVQRLHFLKQAGLAQQLPTGKREFFRQAPIWRLSFDFQKQLDELAARNDVIKTLSLLLGRDAASVIPQIQNIRGPQHLAVPVRGIVVAKGPIDELSDERFIVIEDHAAKLHFARLWASETLDVAKVGSVVDVGRTSHRRHEIAQEIIHVAEHGKEALYSTDRHRQWLSHNHSKLTAEGIERHVRSFKSAIVDLAQKPDSGVARSSENAYVVDSAKLDELVARRNRNLDIRVETAFSLKEQIKAGAYTWLDREIMRASSVKDLPPNDISHNNKVKLAISQRADWLVDQGYAMRAVGDNAGTVHLLADAKTRLVTVEHNELKRRYGETLYYLREGQAIRGVYRDTAYQHRGTIAVIEANHRIYGARVYCAPRADKDKPVIVQVGASQFARIELDKSRGKLRQFGIER